MQNTSYIRISLEMLELITKDRRGDFPNLQEILARAKKELEEINNPKLSIEQPKRPTKPVTISCLNCGTYDKTKRSFYKCNDGNCPTKPV